MNEPYDYYDNDEGKASGSDIVAPALKELEKQKEIYDNLKAYIRHYGAESKEVKTIRGMYPSAKYQNLIDSACRSLVK